MECGPLQMSVLRVINCVCLIFFSRLMCYHIMLLY